MEFIGSVLGIFECISTALSSFPVEKFLELLQDHCLHVCFTCHHDYTNVPNSCASLHEKQQHAHLLLRQPDRGSDNARDKSLCRLYHSHSVVSAILNAKQLVGGSNRRGGGTPLLSKPSTLVTLSKEDNSGTYLLLALLLRKTCATLF